MRVRSTQKLPIVSACLRTKARISGINTAMPVAAETKFWTPSAADWTKWLIVLSPPYALPVRVGAEADRGVERDARIDGGQVVRIAGQVRLQSLERVHDEDAEHVEHHRGDRVLLPRLFLIGPDPEQLVEQPLERTEHPLRDPGLARIDPRHVRAQRDAERDEDDGVEDDLSDAGGGHCSFSGLNSATNR